MSRLAGWCLLAVAAVGCSGEEAAVTRERGSAGPDPATALVADSGVGCLRLGATVPEVRRACGGAADTTIHLEGMPQQGLWVEVDGGRALAEIDDGAVWRIRVRDPALRTRDSISVGMPVSALAGLPGIRIVHGEGAFAMTEAYCGTSFEVAGLPPRTGGWSAPELRALPDSARVVGILVHGQCEDRGADAAAGEAPSLLALYRAAQEAAPGLEPARFEGRRLYIDPEPLVSDEDIDRVEGTARNDKVILNVRLTTGGADRLRSATAGSIGELIVVMLVSEIVAVPIVRTRIDGGRMQIAVPAASPEEADRVIETIHARWPSRAEGAASDPNG